MATLVEGRVSVVKLSASSTI